MARRQAQVQTGIPSQFVSTEAVLYPSAAATAQAFGELGAAASGCHDSSATLTEWLGPDPSAGWAQVAGVDRVTYVLEARLQAGAQPVPTLLVFLRRGRALLALYVRPFAGTMPVPVDG